MTKSPSNKKKGKHLSESKSDNAVTPKGQRKSSMPVKSGESDKSADLAKPHKVDGADEAVVATIDSSKENLIRKRRKRTGSRAKKIRRRIIGAVAAVVILVLVGVGTAFCLTKSGEQAARQASEATEIVVPVTAVSQDAGKTVVYKGETYRLNENIVSVCVIGFDRDQVEGDSSGRNGQADAIMVLAIDIETGKTSAIGIPRDSILDVGEWAGDLFMGQEQMQACLAFSYGTDAQSGAQLTTTAVSHLLYGMPIGHYFAMDMECVGALANSVNGVALTPLESIPKTSIVEGEPTVLFGTNALKYVRYRDLDDPESSAARQARQTQFVKAFASQLTQSSNGTVGMVADLYSTTSQYSVTDIGSDEFAYLTGLFLKNGVPSFEVNPLEIERSDVVDGHTAYYLDQSSIYEAVLNTYYVKVEG